MTDDRQTEVTQILQRWRGGDDRAIDALLPLVYDELRSMARRYMSGERVGHTLQTTALVHEAFVKLVGADVDWQDRVHFFAVAATSMRRILVDRARARGSAKRGGDWARVPLDDAMRAAEGDPDFDFVAVHEALERLAAQDERKAKLIELRFFGGLSQRETGEILGLSAATVSRDLRVAKAWLRRELSKGVKSTLDGDRPT